MRVLLATDRPDLGHALSMYLSERSIQVEVVDDCDCLRAQAAAIRPDVVLVDWGLGEAVSSRIVADLKDRADPTPVIVLSTNHDRPRARASGAAAYATLGDPPDALVAALIEFGSGPADDAVPRPG